MVEPQAAQKVVDPSNIYDSYNLLLIVVEWNKR